MPRQITEEDLRCGKKTHCLVYTKVVELMDK